MRRILGFGLVSAVLLLALAPASAERDATAKQRRGRTVVVNATAGATPITWGWDPSEVEIKSGDTVRWANPTDTAHVLDPLPPTATTPPWWSEQDLPSRGAVSFTFEEPGVYRFGCQILNHSHCLYLGSDKCECVGMCGVIKVRARH